jgi:hypothetical protein
MKPRVGKTAAGGLLAAAVVALTAPLALAQQGGTASLTGAVAQCNANNNEVPLANATISVDGASVTARSDEHGEFRLDGLPAPRVYTVTASGAGQTGVRPNISVQANQSVDVGVIDLGTVLGCGGGVEPGDTSPIPQVAPTFTPAAQAQPTSTPVPTPTNTPVPPAPAPAPSDVNAPPSDVTAPSDVSGPEPATVDVPPSNTDLGPPPADTSPDAGVTGVPGPDSETGP